jgi:allantoinase
MLVQHHESQYWLKRCVDSFDRLYEEGMPRPKFMAIAIHPYISGQPHRIRYLEEVYEYIGRHSGVLHRNGLDIMRWWNAGGRR